MMRRFYLIAVVFALAGCSNLQFQWSASYQTDGLIEEMRAARQREKAPETVPVDVQRDAVR